MVEKPAGEEHSRGSNVTESNPSFLWLSALLIIHAARFEGSVCTPAVAPATFATCFLASSTRCVALVVSSGLFARLNSPYAFDS